MYGSPLTTGHNDYKITSAIAETARVAIRSMIAVDWLTLTLILNMTYVNYISVTELSIRGMLCQLTR